MSLKKWFAILIVVALLTLTAIMGFNYVIDPFGVFGDKVLNWHTYNFVNNPRVAKIGYLDRFNENYNSYVIGGSKSSSLNPLLLNQYYGGDTSFYGMLMYGGDFYDYEKTLYYLVENYQVDNIIIHMSMHEISHYQEARDDLKQELHAKVLGEPLLPFYFKYLTLNISYGRDKLESMLKRKYDPMEANQFIPETGVYNKVVRDAEDLGTREEFLEKYPEFNDDRSKMGCQGAEENLKSLERMKNYCHERGIDFAFVVAPTYYKEMERYYEDCVQDFFDQAAEILDYWNFSGFNSIAYEPRNFYDPTHYRNHVGDLMLAKMFGDGSVEVPEDFGRHYIK